MITTEIRKINPNIKGRNNFREAPKEEEELFLPEEEMMTEKRKQDFKNMKTEIHREGEVEEEEEGIEEEGEEKEEEEIEAEVERIKEREILEGRGGEIVPEILRGGKSKIRIVGSTKGGQILTIKINSLKEKIIVERIIDLKENPIAESDSRGSLNKRNLPIKTITCPNQKILLTKK
jgi:hypothetical protein